MKRIKALVGLFGSTINLPKGEVAEVTDEQADMLIKGGYAIDMDVLETRNNEALATLLVGQDTIAEMPDNTHKAVRRRNTKGK